MAGLFTGHPNPGYLGSATFTPSVGSPLTFRMASFELFDGMNWNDATICNTAGVADYGKGISEGTCRIRAVWDTGLNQEAGIRDGMDGTLSATFGAIGTNIACSWTAYVKNRTNAFTARGLVTMMVTFILVGAGTDFDGATFNYPTVT